MHLQPSPPISALTRRAPPAARSLSKADAALAAALAADPGLAFVTAGWPPAGVKDAEKTALLAKLRAVVAGETDAADLERARQSVLMAPVPDARPHELPCPHGEGVAPTRVDPLYWLRNDARTDPDVLAHLAAENAYTSAVMADAERVVTALAAEMRDAIQEADAGAPLLKRGYWWNWETVEGKEYRKHTRRKAGPSTPGGEAALETGVPGADAGAEEIVLDEDARAAAAGAAFYMAAGLTVPPDGRYAAWGEDVEGGEKYALHVKDLATGAPVGAPVPETAGNYAFSADGAHIFYTVKDALDRPCTVLRHAVAGGGGRDVTVFHEPDDAFYVGVHRSRDDSLIVISSGSAITSETRVLRAAHPTEEPVLLLPRSRDVECDIAPHAAAGALLILCRTANAPNSELLSVPLDVSRPLTPIDLDAAITLVPHRPDVKIEDFVVSRDHVALFERADGAQRARVASTPRGDGLLGPDPLPPGTPIDYGADAAVYELGAGSSGDFDSPVLRTSFSSLATPPSTIDVNMNTLARAVKRVAPVLGGFDASKYATRRLWVPAEHDGTKIPASLVWRTDLVDAGTTPAPLLLYGYGSYEATIDPGFRQTKLPLLDRGWVFAIAHVRGGGDCGRQWYEDGKFDKKSNTWLDFVSVGRHLVDASYTTPALMCCEGRSAGGLLIGAALNTAPDLFAGALAGVPFVDCLTTMLSRDLPLTVIEEDEWGNCVDCADAYKTVASYSPVDNIVRGGSYPTIFASAGLHDPRVGYWEPAKWIANVRAQSGELRGPVLVKFEMGAGHFSKSGRLERLLPLAEEHAFLLKAVGMLHAPKK